GRLTQIANEDKSPLGQLMNWEQNKKMLGWIEFPRDPKTHEVLTSYSYRFTGVESTALALEAAAAVEPENEERIESIKRWILAERGRDGWDNTKTTAEVFRALMDVELGARKIGRECNFTADIDIPKGAAQNLTFDKGS